MCGIRAETMPGSRRAGRPRLGHAHAMSELKFHTGLWYGKMGAVSRGWMGYDATYGNGVKADRVE